MITKSIRARLLVAFCFGALLVIVLAVNFTYALVKKVLYSELDHFLRDKLAYQQIAAAQTNDRVVFRLSEPLLNTMQDPGGKDFFQFRYADSDEREIFRSSGLPEGVDLPNVGLNDEDSFVGHDAEIVSESLSVNGDTNNLLKSRNFSIPIRCMGIVFEPVSLDENDELNKNSEMIKVHLVVAHNCSEIEGVLAKLKLQLLAVGGIVSAAVLLITMLIVGSAVRPVGAISRKISNLEVSDQNECIDLENVPSELIPIIERLNELLGRVAKAINQERQFTSNAAHELRNPLAAIRSQVEVSLASESISDDEYETLYKIFSLQQHMERIVSSLLLLARLDSGSQSVNLEEFPLANLIRKSWKQFFDKASEKGLKTKWEMLESDISIKSDPVLIEIMLSNVFENAVSYTPSDGELVISSLVTDDTVKIIVKNSNPGIQDEEVSDLMRRFGRKNPNFTSNLGHSGIGFSICRRIAYDHLGGQIRVDVTYDWFIVTIEFPTTVVLGNHYHV
ncbi:MAG: HAMP domain-containing sensor histidine kinase [Verrucomicrobiota bacterium]|nr:HAMP domain-containing sensor histidine kinase [Verrucomicrobiota bacterium]